MPAAAPLEHTRLRRGSTKSATLPSAVRSAVWLLSLQSLPIWWLCQEGLPSCSADAAVAEPSPQGLAIDDAGSRGCLTARAKRVGAPTSETV